MKKFFSSTIYSIPVSLISWFLLFALVLFIAGVSNFKYSRNSMKSEKFEEMEAISNLKYQQISGWLKERRGEARFVRDNVQFREMVLALIDYPENENIKTNIREWIKPIVLNHEYSELFLLDKELNTLMTFSENPANQFNFEIVSKFFNGAKGNHIVTTELFKLPNKEPFLLNIVPYYNPENSEEITGYFVFKIEATTQLFPLLAETGLKNTFETYLVVFKTDTAIFISPLKHMEIVPGEYKIPLTKQEIAIVRYQSGEDKLIEGLDYRNVKVLSYTRKITDTNWHLVAEVDQDEIYEQIYLRAFNTFVFISVLIMLTGFILFYLWKSREVNFLKKEKEGKKEREALLKQFDYLTRYANDIILLMNDRGKIIWANERAVNTYGYTENELLSMRIDDIRAPHTRITLKNYFKRTKAEGGLIFETEHLKKNGQLFPVEVSSRYIEVEDKFYFQSIIRDISVRKEAEKTIQLWADIFHNTKVGVVIGYPDNMNLGIMNPAFAEMHGYSPDELKDKPISVIFSPEVRDTIGGMIQMAHDSGHYLGESVHLRKDGSEFPVSLDITAVKDQTGKVLYRVVNVQDITERKKTEEEMALLFEISSILNETENLDSALQSVIQKICETCEWDYGEAWLQDETGELLVHSRNFYSGQKGYDEFVTKSSDYNLRPGEDLPGKAWSEKNPVWYKELSLEKNFLRKELAKTYGFTSGFSIPVFVGGNLIAVLVFFVKKIVEEDMRLIKLISSVTSHFGEVLQRKWAEGEIRKLSVALEQNPVAVEISNPFGVVEYVNQKFVENSGYQRHEIVGKEAGFIRLRETDREKYKEIIESIKNYETWSGELLSTKVNGKFFWEQINISGIRNNSGKILYYIAVIEDISHRKSLEHDLIIAKELAEEASRLKSAILANMSHEIRTPLNGILGFSQILKNRVKDADNLLMVESIKESGERLFNTLSSLVEISNLESQPKLVIKKCNLFELAEKVIVQYLIKADEKELYIINQVPLDCMIDTDSEKLGQAMKYLIENAIKFTESGGVTISYEIKGMDGDRQHVIRVSDTGIGIPEDKAEKLFEPFWQHSQGRERIYEGIGVGLTIVKKIINLLNGEINIESKPGKGASFLIHLPVEQDLRIEKPVSGEKAAFDVTKVSNNLKPFVLIVEDNSINASLLKTQLEDCCETDMAADGKTAIGKTREKNYDIILMDINLGTGMDGIQVTQEIRKLPGYEDTPIVAVTGYALPSDKEKFLSSGLTHFLPKPFTQEDLLILIRSIFHKN